MRGFWKLGVKMKRRVSMVTLYHKRIAYSGQPVGWVFYEQPIAIHRGGGAYTCATSTCLKMMANSSTLASKPRVNVIAYQGLTARNYPYRMENGDTSHESVSANSWMTRSLPAHCDG